MQGLVLLLGCVTLGAGANLSEFCSHLQIWDTRSPWGRAGGAGEQTDLYVAGGGHLENIGFQGDVPACLCPEGLGATPRLDFCIYKWVS